MTIRIEPPSPIVLPGDERPWTVREAAAFLGLRQQTVYLWVEKKKIPHLGNGTQHPIFEIRLGNLQSVVKQEVEKY